VRQGRQRASAREEGARLGPREWEIAALEMIGELGVVGLAIEPLARRLGVTKGSFYWHFESPQELLRASLARWERVFTDGKYGALEKRLDARRRLEALFHDVASGDPALGVFHALSLEQNDPVVGPIFRRVMAKRLRFLRRALGELGLTPVEAEERSVLLYSTYIGFLQLGAALPRSTLSARRRQRLVREAFRLLVPAGERRLRRER
jgi:AcrR family transcriptional regulator